MFSCVLYGRSDCQSSASSSDRVGLDVASSLARCRRLSHADALDRPKFPRKTRAMTLWEGGKKIRLTITAPGHAKKAWAAEGGDVAR